MDEKYEKLYSYGKSLTQDLQAVQDHLYRALCQSEAEKAVEAKRFKEEISRLKQKLVDQRTDSERTIQRLTDSLEQEKRDAQRLTQEVDNQIAVLKNSVKSVAEYHDFWTEQQANRERKLKDKEKELDKREEELEKKKEKLEEAKKKLAGKSHKIEKENKSKKGDPIHPLKVDNDKCRENDNLRTDKNILEKKDGEITKLNKELATYKHPGETENIDKIESNRILIGGIDYPMQDDSDK